MKTIRHRAAEYTQLSHQHKSDILFPPNFKMFTEEGHQFSDVTRLRQSNHGFPRLQNFSTVCMKGVSKMSSCL
jgi:pantothenate synthetase